MVTGKQRKLIGWMLWLRLWKAQSDGLWGRIMISPRWGTAWLLARIYRAQVSDGLHHAPACPANEWDGAALVFQRCSCGANRKSARRKAA